MKNRIGKLSAVFCLIVTLVLAIVPMFAITASAEDTTATLSFADTAQRTEYSTSKQVWEQNGIKLTNNKAKSTSNVGDYVKPARFYASSELVIEAPGNITKIVFDCNSSSYATAMKNSIGSVATVSSDKVEVVLDGSSTTYTVAKITAQVRVDSITVTYTPSDSPEPEPDAPACEHNNTKTETTKEPTKTEKGEEIITCLDCGEIVDTVVINALGCKVDFVVPDGVEKPRSRTGLTATMPDGEVPEDFAQKYTFAGWAMSAVDDTTVMPTLYAAGTKVTLTDDTTFYAVYTYSVSSGDSVADSWELSDTITSGDTVVITMSKGGTLYALNSRNSSSSAPAANTPVTVSDGKITSDVDDSIKWLVSAADSPNSYTFHPNGDMLRWLYCTNDNNGVRVGTGGNALFTVAGNYLQNAGTGRYLGVYNTQDWRCYNTNTGNSNIANQTLGFYVLKSSETNYYTTTLEAIHEHSYTSTQTKAPTCTEDGEMTYTCACGDSYTEAIEATGHDYSESVTKPTCTDKGYTTYTCAACGDTYTDNEVPATGHSYSSEVTAPTCTAAGYTTYTCGTCGDAYTEAGADALGHTYSSEETQAPTCTEDGVKTYTCACGYSYTEAIAATGHNYSTKVTAPTCTAAGYTTYTCDTCGDNYVADEVAALGHTYSTEVTAPTCTEAGYTTYTCACGDNYVADEVAATGHNYVDGVCACGEKEPVTEIAYASVNIGTDLSLLYYIQLANGKNIEDYTMKFTFNGKVTVVSANAKGVFVLEGIAPQQMADVALAELYEGEVLVDSLKYSIQAYANTILAGDYSETIKNLVNAMLYYGKAAQDYTGYDKSEIVTNGDAPTAAPETTDFTNAAADGATVTTDIYVNAAGVNYDYTNKLYIKIKVAESFDGEFSVMINNGETEAEIVSLGNGVYIVYTDAINAAEFDETFYFTLYVNGAKYQIVSYSVNAYAYAKKDASNEFTKALALALYNYGLATEAYLAEAN